MEDGLQFPKWAFSQCTLKKEHHIIKLTLANFNNISSFIQALYITKVECVLFSLV